MTEGKRAFSGRVLAGLLALNLVAHFVPLSRPGFQQDDFMWLHHSRVEPEWSFVPLSLSQETRPLGWLLYILMPKLAGLHEGAQLAILISMTSLLTGLVYIFLAGLLKPPLASLAAAAFVVWPVKHEIYSSQVVGVGILAAVLIVLSGLFYRRYARDSNSPALLLSLLCYSLSIFIYELGYLAPVVFYLCERSSNRKPFLGLALFLIPATAYWMFRFTHAGASRPMGEHPLSTHLLAFNLATSLPSNLFGFQAARNLGYGFWGLINGPLWFLCFAAISALILGFVSNRWIAEGQQESVTAKPWRPYAMVGITSAALLALPAAMVLVESRHSILASAGIGAAIAAVAVRWKPPIGAAALVALLLASQGLALRQVEAAELQSAARNVLIEHREEIRRASVVVVDLESLANRVPYTWGERSTNTLRSYWGIFALSSGAFSYMVDDALYGGTIMKGPRVGTCAAAVSISETTVSCERNHMGGKPFAVPRAGTVVIDFKTMALPTSIRSSTTF
jgi:hypothetical protein